MKTTPAQDFFWDFSLMQNCPICDSRMDKNVCCNGCFKFESKTAIIFGEYFSTHNHVILKMQNQIKYWKTDGRYLIKIMGV